MGEVYPATLIVGELDEWHVRLCFSNLKPPRSCCVPHSSEQRAIAFFLQCFHCLNWKSCPRALETVVPGLKVDKREAQA